MSKFFTFQGIALLGLILAISPVKAQDIRFIQPVDCTIGKDCWIVNYVDVNPTAEKAEDFTCGPRSYDDHKGTDFALRSRAEMRSGIAVLAAADGTIERLRNGEEDSIKTQADMDELKKNSKECGNGVLIDHGQGLKSIYCHMKKDSISVAAGDKIKTGEKIGEVGQSGMAEFPHLHFGVLWEDGIADPFTGLMNTDGCGQMKTPLWAQSAKLGYENAAIFDAGLRTNVPDFKAIEDGESAQNTARTADTRALVLWGAFYGIRAGDIITMAITDAQGRLVKDQTITQESTRARQYYYTGRKFNDRNPPSGDYTGTITLKRAGEAERTKTVKLKLQ